MQGRPPFFIARLRIGAGVQQRLDDRGGRGGPGPVQGRPPLSIPRSRIGAGVHQRHDDRGGLGEGSRKVQRRLSLVIPGLRIDACVQQRLDDPAASSGRVRHAGVDGPTTSCGGAVQWRISIVIAHFRVGARV